MQIIIKPYNGGVEFPLEVQPTDNVYSVKLIIQARENVVPEHQRLLFDGMQLEEGRPFDYYKITEGSTIHLFKSEQPGSWSTKYKHGNHSFQWVDWTLIFCFSAIRFPMLFTFSYYIQHVVFLDVNTNILSNLFYHRSIQELNDKIL